MIRFNAIGAVAVVAFLAHPLPAPGQNIAGEYQVEVRGTTYHTDRAPETRQLRDNTTLRVKQTGDQIEIEFRSFASAMSATTFRGRVGHGRFVAVWTYPAAVDETRLITGEVDGGRLRGRLIYPRANADAGVPGWTEVEFSAVRHERQTGQAAQQPAGQQTAAAQPPKRPGNLRLPGAISRAARANPTNAAAADAAAFAVGVNAMTVPEAPLTGHRIEFLARGTPSSRGESVARMELWVNGLVQGSSDGNVLEVMAGPFPAGRLAYDVVAISSDGRRSEPARSTVDIARAGNTVIRGGISGNRDKISDVQLVRADGLTVAVSKLDSDGDYRFLGVPAGDYVIFVNDAKTEARVSPTSNLEISVNGRKTYTRNFEVR
ncbi:MAG: hypothetical protein ABFS14_08720 [Gemmatimonadota bacterium]